MNISIILNIIFTALSIVLVGFSLYLIHVTLKQNNKMLEASTRPYMSAYLEGKYGVATLVLKNYGNSPAEIISFHSSLDFSAIIPNAKLTPFRNIEGSSFPPGHAVSTIFPYEPFVSSCDEFKISIKYSANGFTYNEEIPINIKAIRETWYTGTVLKPGNEFMVIAESLRGLKDRFY